MKHRPNLADVAAVLDFREDDSFTSWDSSLTYAEALEAARAQLRTGYHIMTLVEYVALWQETLSNTPSLACNSADVWDSQAWPTDANPLRYFRHPYESTVLVDTVLTDVRDDGPSVTASVEVAGSAIERVALPPTGKIYATSHHGLPTHTGGRKTPASEAFEHRWWAFSSQRLADTDNFVVFANGGTVGCFCEFIKVHYSPHEAGGFFHILSLPDD